MQEGKTIGQLMEEMRQKAGAQNYHGHDYMDLQRFAENTRHMIIFDVLTHDSPVGWKGERTRLFLSEICRRMPSEKVWGHRPPVPVFWKSWYLPVFWNEKRTGKRCSFSLPTMQFP